MMAERSIFLLTHRLLLPLFLTSLQPATTPSCNALLTPGPPHLLRTTPGSTPSTPGHILLAGGTPLKGMEERLLPTLIPTNMQSLVNQIQQAQVHTCAGEGGEGGEGGGEEKKRKWRP